MLRCAYISQMKNRLLPGVRAGWRLGMASSCVIVGLCAAGLTAAPALRGKRQRIAQFWFRSLLRSLNVQVEIRGALVAGGSLQVANHISWLDVVVLGATGSTRFVAKAEIEQWPFVGRLATAIDTVFLPRGQHQSGTAAEYVGQRLLRGESVVVFPEATTTDGRATAHFYARFFAASITSRRPVQPLALQYRVPGGDYQAIPYIGDISFGESLLALLSQPRIEVRVTRQPPIYPDRHDRKALARATRDSIVVALAQPRDSGARAEQPDGVTPRLATVSRLL